MIVVTGEFRFGPENMAQAREAMARVIAATRAEDGCLHYSYAEDVLDPGLIRVSEKWTDRAALTAHFTMPHMAQWKAEREALGLTGRIIVASEAGPEESL
jgi:quinol monooxygenase YgiN